MPSPLDPAETAYLCALEECFVAVRGRGVQWAPSDAQVANHWNSQGIPLSLVLRVVQARVRAWRFRHGDTARLPMALRWYSPAVLQAARPLGPLGGTADAPSARPGDTLPEPSAETGELPPPAIFAELLDPLPALLEQTRHLALKHAYSKAFDALDRAQRPANDAGGGEGAEELAEEAALGDPEALIAKVRQQMRKLTVAGLSEAEAAALEAWLAPQRAQLTLRLSRKAAAERLQVLQEQWLGQELAMRVPTPWGWLDPRDAP